MIATAQVVTTEIVNGQKYIATVYRGTQYSLKLGSYGWEVMTRRIGYGDRFHMGGFKRFAALAELAAGCKAFGNAESILAMYYGIEA